MDSFSLGRAVLVKVVAKLGGPANAALQLGISRWTLSSYLNGAVRVSDETLLRAVDVVLDG